MKLQKVLFKRKFETKRKTDVVVERFTPCSYFKGYWRYLWRSAELRLYDDGLVTIRVLQSTARDTSIHRDSLGEAWGAWLRGNHPSREHVKRLVDEVFLTSRYKPK